MKNVQDPAVTKFSFYYTTLWTGKEALVILDKRDFDIPNRADADAVLQILKRAIKFLETK